MTEPPLLYVYAIVSLSEDRERVTSHLQRMTGIDGTAVELAGASSAAAPMAVLASQVSAERYAAGEVESRVAGARVARTARGGARSRGHLGGHTLRRSSRCRSSRCSAMRARFAPCSMFGARSSRDSSPAFAALASTRVRIYRDDAALGAALSELSPTIRELEASASRASPGQRYLLQRKIDEGRRAELKRVSSEVAQATYRALVPLARASVREPLPAALANVEARGATTQPAILNASFLVEHDRLDDFRRALSESIALRSPAGFRVRLHRSVARISLRSRQ